MTYSADRSNADPTTATTADAPIIINARLAKIIGEYRQLHLDVRRGQLSAETCAELDALQADLNAMYLRLRTLEHQSEERATEAPANPDAYNGWTNYETWCAHLWLSNDAYTDATAREIVATAWNNAADQIAADREAIVAPHADAADALRDWLRDEENPLADMRANVYTDLLGHALGRVNWHELAEAFQPDPLPSLEPLADPEDEEEPTEEPEEQEGPEPEWWRSARERED